MPAADRDGGDAPRCSRSPPIISPCGTWRKAFADERIAPHALAWDEAEHFPVDVLREAAGLGMATIYVREENGGSG